MRPDEGGCADQRRSLTARTKVVRSNAYAPAWTGARRATLPGTERRPHTGRGRARGARRAAPRVSGKTVRKRAAGVLFPAPARVTRRRGRTTGARKHCHPTPSDPWTGPPMRSSLTYGGCGRTHTAHRHGGPHSGTTDLTADWGAFHDTYARPAPQVRGFVRPGGRRYPCPRLGRDPGAHAGTALRGGVRAPRSGSRYADALPRLRFRAGAADRGLARGARHRRRRRP